MAAYVEKLVKSTKRPRVEIEAIVDSMSANGRWDHSGNGQMALIPRDLHDNLPHTGGFADTMAARKAATESESMKANDDGKATKPSTSADEAKSKSLEGKRGKHATPKGRSQKGKGGPSAKGVVLDVVLEAREIQKEIEETALPFPGAKLGGFGLC